MQKNIYFIIILYLLVSCKQDNIDMLPNSELSLYFHTEKIVSGPIVNNNMVTIFTQLNRIIKAKELDVNGTMTSEINISNLIPLVNLDSLDFYDFGKWETKAVFFAFSKGSTSGILKANPDGTLAWRILNIGTLVDLHDVVLGIYPRNDGGIDILNYYVQNANSIILRHIFDSNGQFQKTIQYTINKSIGINRVHSISNESYLIFYSEAKSEKQGVMQINTNGTIDWDYVISTPQLYDIYSMYITQEGNFLFSASYLPDGINMKGLVFLLDKSGKLLWQYSSTNMQEPIEMFFSATENDDSFFLSGCVTRESIYFFDFSSTFGKGRFTPEIMKISKTGIFQWSKKIEQDIMTDPLIHLGIMKRFNEGFTIIGGKYSKITALSASYIYKTDNEGNLISTK